MDVSFSGITNTILDHVKTKSGISKEDVGNFLKKRISTTIGTVITPTHILVKKRGFSTIINGNFLLVTSHLETAKVTRTIEIRQDYYNYKGKLRDVDLKGHQSGNSKEKINYINLEKELCTKNPDLIYEDDRTTTFTKSVTLYPVIYKRSNGYYIYSKPTEYLFVDKASEKTFFGSADIDNSSFVSTEIVTKDEDFENYMRGRSQKKLETGETYSSVLIDYAHEHISELINEISEFNELIEGKVEFKNQLKIEQDRVNNLKLEKENLIKNVETIRKTATRDIENLIKETTSLTDERDKLKREKEELEKREEAYLRSSTDDTGKENIKLKKDLEQMKEDFREENILYEKLKDERNRLLKDKTDLQEEYKIGLNNIFILGGGITNIWKKYYKLPEKTTGEDLVDEYKDKFSQFTIALENLVVDTYSDRENFVKMLQHAHTALSKKGYFFGIPYDDIEIFMKKSINEVIKAIDELDKNLDPSGKIITPTSVIDVTKITDERNKALLELAAATKTIRDKGAEVGNLQNEIGRLLDNIKNLNKRYNDLSDEYKKVQVQITGIEKPLLDEITKLKTENKKLSDEVGILLTKAPVTGPLLKEIDDLKDKNAVFKKKIDSIDNGITKIIDNTIDFLKLSLGDTITKTDLALKYIGHDNYDAFLNDFLLINTTFNNIYVYYKRLVDSAFTFKDQFTNPDKNFYIKDPKVTIEAVEKIFDDYKTLKTGSRTPTLPDNRYVDFYIDMAKLINTFKRYAEFNDIYHKYGIDVTVTNPLTLNINAKDRVVKFYSSLMLFADEMTTSFRLSKSKEIPLKNEITKLTLEKTETEKAVIKQQTTIFEYTKEIEELKKTRPYDTRTPKEKELNEIRERIKVLIAVPRIYVTLDEQDELRRLKKRLLELVD